MSKPVSQKMGVKEGARTFLMNAPASALDALKLPNILVSSKLDGEFDYMHIFATTQARIDDLLPRFKSHLKLSGMLWVSWPKSRGLKTDLSLPDVIRIGYRHGLVESICLSVDATWSALKFTYPKDGKIYNNRYGTLPANVPRRPS